jgi:anti-sigma factor RsiW
MSSGSAHIDDERLQAYIHGQASTSEARVVESHLAECPTCRKRLTGRMRPETAHDEDSKPPPSVELPETQEMRAIPSQVSVMMVPHTVEDGAPPSVTSIDTFGDPGRRQRRGRARWIALATCGLFGCALVLVTGYLLTVRPRLQSASLTEEARQTLAPVFESLRLERVQHPQLAGEVAYRPGADPAIEQRLDSADDLLRRAVDGDPHNVDARRLLALTQLMHGEPRVARLQYQEIEAILGPTADGHLGQGILDYMAGTVANDPADRTYAFEQAAAHFDAIKLGDPGYPHAVYNRCVVADARGDAEEARHLQQVYRELQPESSWNALLDAELAPEAEDS